MFGYSKCTYKELKSIINRFKKHSEIASIHVYRSTKASHFYLEYSRMARLECSKIKDILYKRRFLDADEIYEKYYINEKAKLNKMNSIEKINNYTSINKLLYRLQKEDSVIIDAIERAIRERVKELKSRECKKENIKESNKRRFLLKVRV